MISDDEEEKKKGDDSILKEITETMVIRRMVGSGRNTPDKSCEKSNL